MGSWVVIGSWPGRHGCNEQWVTGQAAACSTPLPQSMHFARRSRGQDRGPSDNVPDVSGGGAENTQCPLSALNGALACALLFLLTLADAGRLSGGPCCKAKGALGLSCKPKAPKVVAVQGFEPRTRGL